ncbi:nuclear transport factor 2 family protein [Streptomyces avermitilis]|uniref:nuclear transport factor 2 family protein n=1 Tax=Streptomyces avermitilis TaxID=33903 RepID=UPI0033D58F35
MTTYTDRDVIGLLVSRFFRSLDQRHERPLDEEWVRAFATDDVRSETPVGSTEGAGPLLRHTTEALDRFARTQHLSSDLLIDVEPGASTATASWNALMTHVHLDSTLGDRGPDADPLFTVGALYRAELLRTPAGWRFRRVGIDVLWTRGTPPVLPAATGQAKSAAA